MVRTFAAYWVWGILLFTWSCHKALRIRSTPCLLYRTLYEALHLTAPTSRFSTWRKCILLVTNPAWRWRQVSFNVRPLSRPHVASGMIGASVRTARPAGCCPRSQRMRRAGGRAPGPELAHRLALHRRLGNTRLRLAAVRRQRARFRFTLLVRYLVACGRTNRWS